MKTRTRIVLRTVLNHNQTMATITAGVRRHMFRLRRQPFEADFTAIKLLLPNGGLCYDIGANRGQSIESLMLGGAQFRIIAWEPQQDLCHRLRARYGSEPDAWGDPIVMVWPFGASDEYSTTTIYVPYYKGVRFDGVATTDPKEIDAWLRMSMWRFDERKMSVKQYPCQLVRIVDQRRTHGEPVVFIKLDVQGSEFASLRGTEATLAMDRPLLMIEESNDPEMHKWLDDRDYTPWAWRDGRLEHGIGDLNTIWMSS
jgi:FkbM family methyltransferase